MLEQFNIPIYLWEETFQKKFTNFCKKSPILLKTQIIFKGTVKGVLITLVGDNLKYFFQFNYNENVKDFIANIKKFLINFYPKLEEDVYEKYQKSNGDLVNDIENGIAIENLNKFSVKKIGTRHFIIDKVLPWKDTVFIKLIGSDIDGDVLETIYKYKYNKSLVLFLRNIRLKKLQSTKEISKDFFENSFLLSVMNN